jgi:DNA-binding GntR family transcriptional regulator
MGTEGADFADVGAQDAAPGGYPAPHLAGPGGVGLSWDPDARLLASSSAVGPAAAQRPAVNVLADRLAAALVHHEPGWRLPRHSALARRYSVSTAEIDLAVDELVSRHLVRRLADGQLYRASPAEYLIGLEGVPGLVSSVDSMGGEFLCRSRQVSWRLPPEDISWALRMGTGEPVCVLRFMWTAGGEPAAYCTTFVPGDIAGRPAADGLEPLPAALSLVQLSGVTESFGTRPADAGMPAAGTSGTGTSGAGTSGATGAAITGLPSALHIELQAPAPSVARSLRLSAGQPAMMVTIRFDDPSLGRPVALTTAVLRADMFRVVLQSPETPLPSGRGSMAVSWAEAAEDWES